MLRAARVSRFFLPQVLMVPHITPIPRKKPPLVARSPGTRGGFFLESPKISKFSACGGLFWSILSTPYYQKHVFWWFLAVQKHVFPIVPMFSRVYEHASTIRKPYKLCRHVPEVFSSIRTRRYHSQKEKSPRRYDFCFHGRRNARLPFAKTLAYLQIAQKMWFLLFPRVHGRVSTIRKNNRVCTGCVNVVSDVSAGIRTPICHL